MFLKVLIRYTFFKKHFYSKINHEKMNFITVFAGIVRKKNTCFLITCLG